MSFVRIILSFDGYLKVFRYNNDKKSKVRIFIHKMRKKMKKLIYLFVVLGLVAMSQQNYAQFKDWGTKFGIRGSILFPENEFANLGFSGNDNTSFDWFKTSYLG